MYITTVKYSKCLVDVLTHFPVEISFSAPSRAEKAEGSNESKQVSVTSSSSGSALVLLNVPVLLGATVISQMASLHTCLSLPLGLIPFTQVCYWPVRCKCLI